MNKNVKIAIIGLVFLIVIIVCCVLIFNNKDTNNEKVYTVEPDSKEGEECLAQLEKYMSKHKNEYEDDNYIISEIKKHIVYRR